MERFLYREITNFLPIRVIFFFTSQFWLFLLSWRQSCPTLCDPIDGSPPALQARTLEWVAISFSNAWKWKVKVKSLTCVQLFTTTWTAAPQAPPSMGFFQARVLEWGAIAFSSDSLAHTKIKSGFHFNIHLILFSPQHDSNKHNC